MCVGASDVAVRHIASNCRKLKHLTMAVDQISDQSLLSLAEFCPLLETLDVAFCHQLTSDAFVVLAQKCPKISQLNLCLVESFGDSALSAIANNGKLVDINVRGCQQLSDESLLVVAAKCPNLRVLLLWDCPFVSSRAVKSVKEGCPLALIMY